MTDVMNAMRAYPWLPALGLVVVLAFVAALLWKILRSREGFLLGYGNWVVGKWQSAVQSEHSARAGTIPAAPHQSKRDVALLKRSLQLRDGVLTLSRALDGDLAYLLMAGPDQWEAGFQRALQTLVSGVTQVVHPAGRCRCGFFVLDDDEQHLTLLVGEGYTGARHPRLQLDSCAGRALLTGEDYYCRDVNHDPVYWHSGRGSRDYQSIACVPVRSGQAVFGVLCLDAERANAFTAADFAHL
jgi:putative methionine-R-sulfoxide reductase with GAF domain